jgi:hypothetical protein
MSKDKRLAFADFAGSLRAVLHEAAARLSRADPKYPESRDHDHDNDEQDADPEQAAYTSSDFLAALAHLKITAAPIDTRPTRNSVVCEGQDRQTTKSPNKKPGREAGLRIRALRANYFAGALV